MEFHGAERDVNNCNRRIGEKEQREASLYLNRNSKAGKHR